MCSSELRQDFLRFLPRHLTLQPDETPLAVRLQLPHDILGKHAAKGREIGGIEELRIDGAVEATATGQALKNYRDNYASLESEGLHASGVYRMKVLGVNNVSPDGAVMFICVDQHAMDALKADGTSSGRNVQYTYSYMVTLDRSSGSWMVMSDEQMGGADQC